MTERFHLQNNEPSTQRQSGDPRVTSTLDHIRSLATGSLRKKFPAAHLTLQFDQGTPHESGALGSIDIHQMDIERRLGLAALQRDLRTEVEGSLVTIDGYRFPELLATLRSGATCSGDLRIATCTVNEGTLMKLLQERQKELRLSPALTAFYEHLIREMVAKTQSVHALCKQFPNGADLYRFLFGRNPIDAVETIEGPFVLHLRCANLEDYARARRNMDSTDAISTKETQKADGTAACAIAAYGQRRHRLDHIITLEKNTARKPFCGKSVAFFRHEELHQYSRLFDHPCFHVSMARTPWRNGQRQPRTDTLVTESLSLLRALDADFRAKQEILCGTVEGCSPDTIRKRLVGPESETFYRYPEGIAARVRGACHYQAMNLVNRIMKPLFGNDYDALIHKAIDAMDSLVTSGGMDPGTIVEFLITEPLEGWAKLAEDYRVRSGSKVPEDNEKSSLDSCFSFSERV